VESIDFSLKVVGHTWIDLDVRLRLTSFSFVCLLTPAWDILFTVTEIMKIAKFQVRPFAALNIFLKKKYSIPIDRNTLR